MRATVRSFFVVASLCLLAAPASAANPFAPAKKLGDHLTKGVNAALKGKDPKAAFAPIEVQTRTPLTESLKGATVASARLLALEFELIFYQGDRAVFYLRTALNFGEGGPKLLSFQGREVPDGKMFVKGLSPAKFKGAFAPLGAAAKAAIKAVTSAACKSLPVVEIGELPFLPAGKMRDRATQDLAQAKTMLPTQCDKLASLKFTRADLRVDDVVFAALSADGKMVGMIKGDLEIGDKKQVFELGGFRAAKDR
ncbi:MAG: hypothetical protein IT371_28370 [Deltaproteobacteria bacterium]|nr:hypothetical protein [Deltaproteobacteria bacterium]